MCRGIQVLRPVCRGFFVRWRSVSAIVVVYRRVLSETVAVHKKKWLNLLLQAMQAAFCRSALRRDLDLINYNNLINQ